MNYIGYFRGVQSDILYSVKIITDNESAYQEITLAGGSPFVVSYNTNKDQFEPSRTSTASINVVGGDYLFNCYGPQPHSTRIVLTNEDTQEIEWTGFLTNNMSNMTYINVDDVFTMEASDAVLGLQYFDYKMLGEDYAIVTFRDILGNIANTCEVIDEIVITDSKKNAQAQSIRLEDLTISEYNFFSTDEEKEPWKMNEVLDEICRYLGYTAMQWKNKLYLIDYQVFRDNANMNVYTYTKASGFKTGTNKVLENGGRRDIQAEDYRGSGNNISFTNIYNKITVRDSFCKVEDFLPAIMEDELINNRYGSMLSYKEIVPEPYKYKATTAMYRDSKNKAKYEEEDKKYKYYQRQFSHKYYESVYRDKNTLAEKQGYGDGTIECEPVTFERTMGYDKVFDASVSLNISNPFDRKVTVYTRLYAYKGSSIFALQAWIIPPRTTQMCNLHLHKTNAPDYVISYGLPCYTVQYDDISETEQTPYNMSLNNLTDTYVGATIVETASVDQGDPELYNYEVANSIDFQRYLMINQNAHPKRTINIDLPSPYDSIDLAVFSSNGLKPEEIEEYFPEVYRLKSGYTYPVIIDENAYICINCEAMYERYARNYINPDWVSENTGLGGISTYKANIKEDGTFVIDVNSNGTNYNAINGSSVLFHLRDSSKWEYILTYRPILHFKLSVGGKWWNGTDWQDNMCAFRVNLSTNVDKDGKIDYGAWWNNSHKVLNNVPWTDWSGAKGYKIPLNGSLDMSQQIYFAMLLPNRIQEFHSTESHDGMNGTCWIKDPEINLFIKGDEDSTDEDVIYENIILEDAVNSHDEIVCKITTYPNNGLFSYSNVGYKGELLKGIAEASIEGEFLKPEENIVSKYYMQYSTPTKQETLILKNDYTPWNKMRDLYWNRDFVILGQEIDYGADSQTIDMIEIKEGGVHPGETDYIGITNITPGSVLPSEGGTLTFAVRSNRPWTATTNCPWARMSQTSGEGDGSIILTVRESEYAANSEFFIRVTTDKGTSDSSRWMQNANRLHRQHLTSIRAYVPAVVLVRN